MQILGEAVAPLIKMIPGLRVAVGGGEETNWGTLGVQGGRRAQGSDRRAPGQGAQGSGDLR